VSISQLARIAGAVLASSLAPALVFFAVGGGYVGFFAIAFAVALAHTILLGLPLYALLRVSDRVNAASAAVGGLGVGAIPIGILYWPWAPSAGHWQQWVFSMSYFGAFGLVGGLAFWAVLRITRPMATQPVAR
jgi:hypothetical protein